MRPLPPAPPSVIDPLTRAIRFGSYRGPLPRVDLAALSRGRLWTLLRKKRWMYVAIASDELFVAAAVADLGYLCNTFAFAYGKRAGRMLADRSSLGPPMIGEVNDTAAEGFAAGFRMPRTAVRMARVAGSTEYTVEVDMPDLRVRAHLETRDAPAPIAAISRIPGGIVNTTEKRCLLTATGWAEVAGRRFGLDGALGGYDYTHGLLARRTAWRWAFGLGRTSTGARVGLNLVEGFVGEAECALWLDDELIPLEEGRFEFDAKAPLRPWYVSTTDGSVDLRFDPSGLHAEHKNFGVLASRFIQPVGTFRGVIRLPDRPPLELADVMGVTEDQEMLW